MNEVAALPPPAVKIERGQTFWPTEHVYFIVTKAGRLAMKNAKPLTFFDYGDACLEAGPGRFVAAAHLLRVQIL